MFLTLSHTEDKNLAQVEPVSDHAQFQINCVSSMLWSWLWWQSPGLSSQPGGSLVNSFTEWRKKLLSRGKFSSQELWTGWGGSRKVVRKKMGCSRTWEKEYGYHSTKIRIFHPVKETISNAEEETRAAICKAQHHEGTQSQTVAGIPPSCRIWDQWAVYRRGDPMASEDEKMLRTPHN